MVVGCCRAEQMNVLFISAGQLKCVWEYEAEQCDFLGQCGAHYKQFQQWQSDFIQFIEDSNIQLRLTTMTTPIQNISDSPNRNKTEIPHDSIIRRVATPSAYQEFPSAALLHLPQQQPLASFHAHSNLLPPQNSRLIQTAQFIGSPQIHASRQIQQIHAPGQIHQVQQIPQIQQIQQPVPTEASSLPPLPPVRRVEYVPYEQRYIEYVQQKIKVPVQRVCTDYYQVEHIIDYMPIEKEEVVYEVEPQEVVTMRLQYVPVEQKIIHISDKNAKALGIKEYVSTDQTQDIVHTSPLYEAITVNGPTVALNKSKASTIRKSRTNFVTSEGYDPQANLEQIDNILSASSVRGSRARLN